MPHATVFVGAASLFSIVARAVATKRARPIDKNVRAWMQRHRYDTLDIGVKPVTLLSLPPLVVSAMAVLAWRLKSQGRDRAALAVALSPVLASTAGQSFTTFLPQQNPPDRRVAPGRGVVEASFPSGHVTGVLTEALTIGYVLSRERPTSRRALALLAAWPLLVATTRVYRNRHWTSDVVGGLLAGTAVAAITTMVYEIAQ